MINPFDPAAGVAPKVGDKFVTPIAQGPQRVTILPDQSLISSAAHYVELVLLRSEWVPTRQELTVTSVDENGAMISGGETEGQFQIFDVGRVRYSIDAGVDTATNMLVHLVANGRITKEDVLARISAAFGE